MIQRPKPGLHDLFFAIKGSILPNIAGRLGFIALVSIIAVLAAQPSGHLWPDQRFPLHADRPGALHLHEFPQQRLL
jgi:hypothetical protein